MANIDISVAVIAAQPPVSLVGESRYGILGGHVRVFKLGDTRADLYDWNWGACCTAWRADPENQLQMLDDAGATLVQMGIKPYAVICAFQQIEQYLQRVRKRRRLGLE